MKFGASGAQETAAGALHSLAALFDNRAVIADAGGIAPLVAVFDGGSPEAYEQAAGALTNLIQSSATNQRAVSDQLVAMLANGSSGAQEKTTQLLRQLLADSDNRGAIAKAGAIPQLVRQLKEGSEKAQSMAAAALSQIALKSAEYRVQVTQQLVGLLGSANAEVRQRAGYALRDMGAEGGDDSQKTVAMAGGVAPLVALLKDGLNDGRVEAQEYALWSLSLTTDAASRATIVESGCIDPLIASLKAGKLSPVAQEHAAAVLSGLASDSANRDAIVGTGESGTGGIYPLVKLLSTGSTIAQKHAAGGLGRLCDSSVETQALIAESGAIPALVQLQIALYMSLSASFDFKLRGGGHLFSTGALARGQLDRPARCGGDCALRHRR